MGFCLIKTVEYVDSFNNPKTALIVIKMLYFQLGGADYLRHEESTFGR